MSENELSNGFDTDGISKLNHETDDADEENIDISTTKSENNYEDNFDIPVQKKINEKKSPRMVRLSTVILIVLLSITTVLLVFLHICSLVINLPIRQIQVNRLRIIKC